MTQDATSTQVEPAFDTFISYASADKPVAECLLKALVDLGLKPWAAFTDIPGGARYAAEIVQAIASSRTLLVLISSASVRSEHVFREVAEAAGSHRPILPVYIEQTVALPPQLRYYLRGLHRLKVQPDRIEESAGRIAAGIRHHPQWLNEAAAPSLVESLTSSPRRSAGLVLGLSILAGLIVWGFQALWSDRTNRIEQERRDALPDSLAMVQLVAATRPSSSAGAPWRVRVNVILVAPDTPFEQVKLHLASRQGADAAPEVFDVSGAFNPKQLGLGQMLAVEVPRLGPHVTACLSLPHPRTAERWYLTEVFGAQSTIDADGTERMTFARIGGPSARIDSGHTCH